MNALYNGDDPDILQRYIKHEPVNMIYLGPLQPAYTVNEEWYC
jgi:hypothetical protein